MPTVPARTPTHLQGYVLGRQPLLLCFLRLQPPLQLRNLLVVLLGLPLQVILGPRAAAGRPGKHACTHARTHSQPGAAGGDRGPGRQP